MQSALGLTNAAARPARSMLSTGRACVPCRKRKKKCDATLPRCGGCIRYNLPCHYQVLAPRGSRIEYLQQKLARLESQFVSLATEHNKELIAQSLWEKIRILSWGHTPHAQTGDLAIWPYSTLPITAPLAEPSSGIFYDETETGYRPVAPRDLMVQMIATHTPKFDGSPLPAPFSLWMIRLFLPFRLQYHLFIDPSIFIPDLARPPEDAKSIHPALLNAIYLATCQIVGGELSSLKAHFVTQTRLHMEKLLETSDRLTHFLWASLVLGSFYSLEGRLNEAYVTISSCAKFALACGLDIVHFRHAPWFNPAPLLPLPTNFDEMVERWRLSHAIYILDRTFAMLSGYPSLVTVPMMIKDNPDTALFDVRTRENSTGAGDRSDLTQDLQREMDELTIEPLPNNLKIIILYERIEQLAKRVDLVTPDDLEAQIAIFGQALTSHHLALSPLFDSWGLDSSEFVSRLNPMMIFGHVNYHGCVMLLYSLTAREDMHARSKVIDSARALAEMCPQIRGLKGIRRVHGSFILILHMANAARVFASYITTPEVRKSTEKFAMCCESLVYLLEMLHDVVGLYPAWAHILPSIRQLFPQNSEGRPGIYEHSQARSNTTTQSATTTATVPAPASATTMPSSTSRQSSGSPVPSTSRSSTVSSSET